MTDRSSLGRGTYEWPNDNWAWIAAALVGVFILGGVAVGIIATIPEQLPSLTTPPPVEAPAHPRTLWPLRYLLNDRNEVALRSASLAKRSRALQSSHKFEFCAPWEYMATGQTPPQGTLACAIAPSFAPNRGRTPRAPAIGTAGAFAFCRNSVKSPLNFGILGHALKVASRPPVRGSGR